MTYTLRAIVLFAFCTTVTAQAQSYRSLVNDANEAFRQQKYDAARDGYSKAAIEKPDRVESWFNNGNAAYRSHDVEAALRQYEQAGKRAGSREELAGTLYNAGNVFLNAAEKGGDNPVLKQTAGEDAGKLKMEGYRQAIEMYKKSLKLNPSDADARYNLTYARKKLEEMQQQNKQDQNQDKKQEKQDKKEDQQNQDKSKQEEQQKKDQQDQQQQQDQNQKDQQQQDKAKQNEQQKQQQQKPQMSKQQAEQILRALERQEKDLQKEKRQQVPVRISVEKDW